MIVLYLLTGFLAGILSGFLGIGGGVIIIPAFLYIFKFSQHLAQGTTLALMVPPIGLLAAYCYYKQGFVDIKAAILVASGFFIGGYLGSKFAISLSDDILKKAFGFLLLFLAIKLIFFSK